MLAPSWGKEEQHTSPSFTHPHLNLNAPALHTYKDLPSALTTRGYSLPSSPGRTFLQDIAKSPTSTRSQPNQGDHKILTNSDLRQPRPPQILTISGWEPCVSASKSRQSAHPRLTLPDLPLHPLLPPGPWPTIARTPILPVPLSCFSEHNANLAALTTADMWPTTVTPLTRFHFGSVAQSSFPCPMASSKLKSLSFTCEVLQDKFRFGTLAHRTTSNGHHYWPRNTASDLGAPQRNNSFYLLPLCQHNLQRICYHDTASDLGALPHCSNCTSFQ